MRLIALIFVAAFAIPLAGADSGQAYMLPGLESGSLTAGDLSKGQTVAVVWSPASSACRDIVSRINRLVATWGKQARVVTVVAMTLDPATDVPLRVRSFLADTLLEAPVYLDSDKAFSKLYSIDDLPGLLVFKDGSLGFAGKLPVNPDPIIERSLN